MRRFALDSDAFIFLKKLGLLKDLIDLARPPTPRLALHMTSFVARHELSSVLAELETMVKDLTLKIWDVKTKTAAFALFRELKDGGYDKGESELGAWIATESKETILVSCDKAVPRMAKSLKIRSLDIGQLVVVLVKDGLITHEIAEERLSPWSNPHTGIGRPPGWTNLTDAIAKLHPLGEE